MLAMVMRTPLGIRYPASSLTTFASMLAPTGIGGICDIRGGWPVRPRRSRESPQSYDNAPPRPSPPFANSLTYLLTI
jgi:hypothetical protein